jgi:hypothetical protein
VGKAEEVILGFIPSGDDVDSNWTVEQLVYADDGIDD